MEEFINTLQQTSTGLATSAGIIADLRLPRFSSVSQVLIENWPEYTFFLGSVLLAYILFRKLHLFTGLLVLIIGSAWVAFHAPTVDWLNSLGTDSFAETTTFDLDEAKFWLATLRETINPSINVRVFVFYVLLALIVALAVNLSVRGVFRSEKARVYVISFVALSLIAVSAKGTVSGSLIKFWYNSEWYSEARSNFTSPIPSLHGDSSPLNVVVYIGESISVLNMGLYGYPRNTTPNLSALAASEPNFLVFHNVFSTHTHTTPSLLEAFSFGFNADDFFLPINLRKRVSLADVVSKHGVETTLISNQGQTGLWNLSSSIIFGGSARVFSNDSRLLGNRELDLERPLDHEFFAEHIGPRMDSGAHRANVIFLHSYAGHGPYLKWIPEAFRARVDGLFLKRDPQGIVGTPGDRLPWVEEHDSAVRYVDQAVFLSLKGVQSSPLPGIFVFFSDHGEAPYLRLGHDSSRFVHEMARVPFVIYFNDAARREYGDLYERYAGLAHERRVSTLAHFPETLLELLGLAFIPGQGEPVSLGVIGDPRVIPPILVRETGGGLTHVALEENLRVPEGLVGRTKEASDEATKVFVASRYQTGRGAMSCYHRSNTFGTALRGRLISDCLEVDLTVQEGGKLAVYDPEGSDVGVELGEIAGIATRNGAALWINARNVTSGGECLPLLEFVNKRSDRTPVLVEFESSGSGLEGIGDCATELVSSGHFVSYQVPSEIIQTCATSRAMGEKFREGAQCGKLRGEIQSVYDTGLFTDISFDVRYLDVIDNIPVAKEFYWNAREVDVSELAQLDADTFRRFSIGNSDGNAVRKVAKGE